MDHVEITYTVSYHEELHPDPTVVSRMQEFAIGPCPMGCKLYRDPKSNVVVLAHNSAYNCKR